MSLLTVPMRILFCYSRFPWPTIRGDQLTVFKMLEFLSQRHEVDFLCVEPEQASYRDKLPKGLRNVTIVENPMPTRLLRIGKSLLGRGCLQIDSFFSKAFGLERQRLLERNSYDIVYSHYIRSFGSTDFDAGKAKKVIGLQLSHQAHFEKAASTARNPVIRQLYRIEAERLKTWEGQVAGWNDLIHLISKRDMLRVQGHERWQERVFFNPHGVDEQMFVPAPERRVKDRVVFTGNLKFQANEDAIAWFCESIWPEILRMKPETTLLVAGAHPTDKVRSVVNLAGNASLQPNPEHMWDVIQTADVTVDPLRIGAGLQNKILEALACGVPMVSTTLGNEGIGAEPGMEILLADKEEAFAKAVVSVLNDPELRGAVSKAGRAFIERAWSWEHHFEQLEDRWKELVSGREVPKGE